MIHEDSARGPTPLRRGTLGRDVSRGLSERSISAGAGEPVVVVPAAVTKLGSSPQLRENSADTGCDGFVGGSISAPAGGPSRCNPLVKIPSVHRRRCGWAQVTRPDLAGARGPSPPGREGCLDTGLQHVNSGGIAAGAGVLHSHAITLLMSPGASPRLRVAVAGPARGLCLDGSISAPAGRAPTLAPSQFGSEGSSPPVRVECPAVGHGGRGQRFIAAGAGGGGGLSSISA